MGDYFHGDIKIGGVLNAKLKKKLIEVLNQEGVKVEENGEAWTYIDKEIELAINQGRPAYFFDHEASYGKFEDLETFCQDHNLPYSRRSNAKYEYDAELVWWFPGVGDATLCASNSNGDALIHIKHIQEIIENKNISSDQIVQQLTGVIAPFTRTLPPLTFDADATC